MVKPFHPANRGTRYGMRNVNPAETGTRKELENEKNWERRTILVDWAMPGYADPLCVVFFWLVLTARNHWKDVTSKRSDCSACFQIPCIRDSRHRQNMWKIWPILADSWLTNSTDFYQVSPDMDVLYCNFRLAIISAARLLSPSTSV